jgi:hypothetical protein|tara:strand:+ start:213 stop:578 length:366 start_codon:yes stop_codon:yes gene_type:complete
MNNNLGEKMIKLTDKENKLVQHLLDDTDGSDAHCCNSEWDDHKRLGWTFETYRGVFGSIVDKGLLEYTHQNDNGDIYVWAYPVHWEVHQNDNYEIKTTSDYLNAVSKGMTIEKIQKLEERA